MQLPWSTMLLLVAPPSVLLLGALVWWLWPRADDPADPPAKNPYDPNA